MVKNSENLNPEKDNLEKNNTKAKATETKSDKTFEERLTAEAKQTDTSTPLFSDQLTDEKMEVEPVAKKVVSILKKKRKKVSEEAAGVAVLNLIQKGAPIKSIDPSLSVAVRQKKRSKERAVRLTVRVLQDSFQKCRLKGKIRKFARKHRTMIANLSGVQGINGTLYGALKRRPLKDGAVFPENLGHWMSDFQSTNPDCPVEVRNLIAAFRSDQQSRVQAANARIQRAKAGKKRKKKSGK